MIMKKAIFWDFDGTLVYSEHLWSGSLLRTLELYTKDNRITLDEIRPHMAYGFTWDTPEKDFLSNKVELCLELTNIHIESVYRAAGIPEKEILLLLPLYRQVLTDVRNFHVYDDMEYTLNALKGMGFEHYILSNNFPELDDIANSLGFDKLFNGYIISAHEGYDKPRREIFEAAYEKAGRPQKCFMVGDNPNSDIAGAENFGIPGILVHNENTKGHDCIVCPNLKDIIPIADKICDM